MLQGRASHGQRTNHSIYEELLQSVVARDRMAWLSRKRAPVLTPQVLNYLGHWVCPETHTY